LYKLYAIETGLLEDEIIMTQRFQELYENIFNVKSIDKEKMISLISLKSKEINIMIDNYK
jgi:hypothetical protein